MMLEILGLFIANAGLIFWMRSESRSDWRHMDAKLDIYMKDSQKEMKEFREKWLEESKDFHGRLCSIEERRLKEK